MADQDEELCRRAREGDPEALACLWQAHRRWVGAVLLAWKPAGVELEDLLQEVAVALVRGIGGLRDAARLRPWLRSIAVNAARSAGRRAEVRGESLTVDHGDGRGFEPVDPAGRERLDEARHVLALAARLEPKYREPLLLRAVQGLSQAQIAAALELPETTVETRLARARRMLRAALDAERDAGRGSPCAELPHTRTFRAEPPRGVLGAESRAGEDPRWTRTAPTS